MAPIHKTVWLASQAFGDGWQFRGVFESEKEAVEACLGHEDYFIGPAPLGIPFPDDASWNGAYYPNGAKE